MSSKYDFKPGTPDFLKKRAIAICERFFINGLCDPMYIANSIAYEIGCGDGQGHFYEDIDKWTDLYRIAAIKAARHLAYAYGCNIMKTDFDELVEILQYGYLNPKTAKEGIKQYYAYLVSGIKRATAGGDGWRVEYLQKCQKEVLRSKMTRNIIPYAWDATQRVECRWVA